MNRCEILKAFGLDSYKIMVGPAYRSFLDERRDLVATAERFDTAILIRDALKRQEPSLVIAGQITVDSTPHNAMAPISTMFAEACSMEAGHASDVALESWWRTGSWPDSTLSPDDALVSPPEPSDQEMLADHQRFLAAMKKFRALAEQPRKTEFREQALDANHRGNEAIELRDLDALQSAVYDLERMPT